MTHRFLRVDDQARSNWKSWHAHLAHLYLKIGWNPTPLLRTEPRHAARYKPANRRSFPQIPYQPFPNERPGRNRVSFLNQNPVRVFPCSARTNVQRPTHLRNATARRALSVQNWTSEKLLCGDEIFCHLRSAWTPGSRSIARFCFSILSSLSPSASTWGARRKISKTSRWADGECRGGRCSHRSSPRKQLQPLSLGHPERDSRSATTPICNWRSAPSSRGFSSATCSSSRTTTTKFTPSTNTLLPALACQRKTPGPRCLSLRDCLPPARACISPPSHWLSPMK